MVKAVLFDFGNVLYGFDYDRFFQSAARHSSLGAGQIREVLLGGEESIAVRFENGKLSSGEFLALISERAKIELPPERLAELFTGIFEPLERNIALAFESSELVPIALISNTNALHFERFMSATPIVSAMAALGLSYQVGAMKPAPAIFHAVLDRLELEPQDCVYVDDVKAYTDAARAMGFMAVECHPQVELRRELAGLGLAVKR